MPRLLRYKWWRPLGRRLCAGLVLVAFLATAAGLPSTAIPDKDRSLLYPCRNHLCGCRSADDCWRHCCCYSRDERLAWAADNGVTPPAAAAESPAVAAAPEGWNTPRLRDQTEGRTAAPAADCPECARGTRAAAPDQPAACCRTAANPDPWRLALAAVHCRRPATVWVTTGAVVPPPRPTWTAWAPLADSLSYPDVSGLTLSASPPDPPPRYSVV
jgi:hypothetical protein